MKKHKIILVLLVVLTVAVAMLAACDFNQGHEHKWEKKYDSTNHWEECECGEIQNKNAHVFTDVVTDPTCTESGYTTHTCECGYSYTDGETAPSKHVYETNKDDENHWLECAVCKDKKDIAAHVCTSVVTNPTCTESGYTTYTCECGYSYTDGETAPSGHKNVEKTDAVVASYAIAGTKEYFMCGVCKKHFEDEECAKEITNLEEWLKGNGLVLAQKDDDTFGTEENPYTIANRTDYDAVADACNDGNKFAGKYIKLIANIGSVAEPVKSRIGNSTTNYFAGNFDGNNKEIYVVLSSDISGVAVFGYVSGASISDLTVKGQITYNGTSSAAGSIVGVAVYGTGVETTVTGCKNYATITATGNSQYAIVGGIVGSATGNLKIKNCLNCGTLTSEKGCVGGMLGRLQYLKDKSHMATIEDCLNDESAVFASSATIGDQAGLVEKETTLNVSYARAKITDADIDKIVGKAVTGAVVNITHTTHTFTHAEAIEANCTETGLKERYVCNGCGKTFERDGENYIEKTIEDLTIAVNDNHAYGEWTHDDGEETHSRVCNRNSEHKETVLCEDTLVKGDTTAPDFDKEGYTEYTCSVCGATYKKDVKQALLAVAQVGETKYQNLDEAIKAAGNDGIVTLLSDGETKLAANQTLKVKKGGFTLTVTTEVAGKSVNEITDSESGVTTYTLAEKHVHNYSETKYDDKNHWQECSCGEKQNVSEHVYTDVVTNPTCTEGGYTTYTCECGYSYTGAETAPSGHKNVEKTDAIAASYVTAGTKEYFMCGVCNKHFEDEECTKEITNLEEWLKGIGLVLAQKDDDTFGTEDNPYTIANKTDYDAVADACNDGNKFAGKYIKLIANIGSVAEPVKSRIGNSTTNYFAGNFDGNNKTVYLGIGTGEKAIEDYVGMFGAVGGTVTIKNVNVDGNVKGGATKSESGVAAIVGLVINKAETSLAISDCVSNVRVVCNATNPGVGGIVGRANRATEITNCTNNGDIEAPSAKYSGGIIGYGLVSIKITNCTNTGNVSALTWAGGIIGLFNKSGATLTISNVTVSNCTLSVSNTETSKTSLGGVMGRATIGTVKYADWNVSEVVFMVADTETEAATTGFEEKKTADGKPGLMFGSCGGTISEIAK